MSGTTINHFGMGFSRMNMPLGDIRNFPDFSAFSAVELPPELLLKNSSAGPLPGGARLSRYQIVHCGGIMDRAVSRAIVHSGKRLQDDFAREAERVLRRLREAGIRVASLECGMNELLGDHETESVLRRILRLLAPVLTELDTTLLLPFRLPSLTAATTLDMNRFLRETLVKNVKLRLDVHPHELGARPNARETAGCLGFEMRSVVFVYDADCGGRIRRNHLQTWLEYGKKFGYSGPYLLAPGSLRQRMALPEADAYAKLAGELRTTGTGKETKQS